MNNNSVNTVLEDEQKIIYKAKSSVVNPKPAGKHPIKAKAAGTPPMNTVPAGKPPLKSFPATAVMKRVNKSKNED